MFDAKSTVEIAVLFAVLAIIECCLSLVESAKSKTPPGVSQRGKR